MKKVLIALDYDPSAKTIAEKGYALAKTMGAEIILLHVIAEANYYSSLEYSPIVGFTGFADIVPVEVGIDKELNRAADSYLESLKQLLEDKSIQTLVREGDFAESILEAAKDMHADIIVMGSHSRKWLENIIMGSVTEKVLKHTTVPLFIIPTKRPK